MLGLSLAVAPVGAWLAIRGRFEAVPLALGLAVVLWVAGFDTIYACQDVEFDRREGLRSIPARLGVPRALAVARALHVAAVARARWASSPSRPCTRSISPAWPLVRRRSSRTSTRWCAPTTSAA